MHTVLTLYVTIDFQEKMNFSGTFFLGHPVYDVYFVQESQLILFFINITLQLTKDNKYLKVKKYLRT